MNKHLPKLQRFERDKGSAVVEFVLLGAPALLVLLMGLSIFSNFYIDTIARAIAVDASRFAALADQQATTAQNYLDSKTAKLLPGVAVTSAVSIDSNATVKLVYSPSWNLFNSQVNQVRIVVSTPVEAN